MYISIMLALIVGQGWHPASAQEDVAKNRFLVVFEHGFDASRREAALVRSGATPLKHLPLVSATSVLASPESHNALRNTPGVLRVEPDVIAQIEGKLSGNAKKKDPQEVLTWGVDTTDADNVWGMGGEPLVTKSVAGNGVRVAVLDTGIDLKHPDLAQNIKGGVNTIKPNQKPTDDNGHGSHVAGIIGAIDNSVGVIGVAPQVSLYAVKVLDKSGMGYISDIIEGITWSIDNNMQIINMSFSIGQDIQSLREAVELAHSAGIIMVAAAGNSGPADNTVRYPAKYPEVIAVSAIDRNLQLPNISARGPEILLAAPGVEVYSCLDKGDYGFMYGTSMAAPHVSGTAALIISSGVTTKTGVIERLISGAVHPGIAPDNAYGYGAVSAARSVGQ